MMKFIVLSCFLLGVATAQRVSQKTCSSDKDGYVKVNNIDIKDAIRFPSTVSSAIDIEILQDVPEGAKIQLQVHRIIRLFGERRVKIPCVKNAGSCEYDVCRFLVKGNDGDTRFDLCNVFPEGTECKCPLQKMNLKNPDAKLGFPALPGIAKLLVSGKYAVNAKFIDPADNKSFFCIDLEATLG